MFQSLIQRVGEINTPKSLPIDEFKRKKISVDFCD